MTIYRIRLDEVGWFISHVIFTRSNQMFRSNIIQALRSYSLMKYSKYNKEPFFVKLYYYWLFLQQYYHQASCSFLLAFFLKVSFLTKTSQICNTANGDALYFCSKTAMQLNCHTSPISRPTPLHQQVTSWCRNYEDSLSGCKQNSQVLLCCKRQNLTYMFISFMNQLKW